jgi:hypothetical protein
MGFTYDPARVENLTFRQKPRAQIVWTTVDANKQILTIAREDLTKVA